MERFSAEQFYMIGRVIEQLGNDLNPNPFFANKIVDRACQESFFESVGGIKIHCAKIGLRQSVKCCDQLLTDAKDPLIATHSLTHAQLGNFIEQLGDLVDTVLSRPDPGAAAAAAKMGNTAMPSQENHQ